MAQPRALICYASRTGTRRNLDVLRRSGWRMLVSPASPYLPPDFRFAIDNGAWPAFVSGVPFDEVGFERLVDRLGARADWVVAPDIVGGGLPSLELSLRWSNRLLSCCGLVLIAVQDGMVPADLRPFVGPNVGIFLGGTTPWKLETMEAWGSWAAGLGIHFHVARVNTRRRFRLAIASGALSVDGSSVSRFAVNMTKLDQASREMDLFAPEIRCRAPGALP